MADQVTVATATPQRRRNCADYPPRRRNLLLAFIAKAGAPLPSTAQMNEISTSLLIARADAQPQVDWPGGVIRRRAGRLELQVTSELADTRAPETVRKAWRWNDVREYTLNVAGDSLTLVDDPAGVIDLDKLPRVLQLRARSGGENLRPGPRARTQALKKLMQAARFTVGTRAPPLC